MRGHSEALCNFLNVRNKVHGAGSAESAKSQKIGAVPTMQRLEFFRRELRHGGPRLQEKQFMAWY